MKKCEDNEDEMSRKKDEKKKCSRLYGVVIL